MDVYGIVTEKIVNLLEQGIVPWRKPWASIGLPRLKEFELCPSSLPAMERSSITKAKAMASRSSSRTETWVLDSSSFFRPEFNAATAAFCMNREAAGCRGNPLTRSMMRKPRRQTCTSFCELWGGQSCR
jgi:hypothetical protein